MVTRAADLVVQLGDSWSVEHVLDMCSLWWKTCRFVENRNPSCEASRLVDQQSKHGWRTKRRVLQNVGTSWLVCLRKLADICFCLRWVAVNWFTVTLKRIFLFLLVPGLSCVCCQSCSVFTKGLPRVSGNRWAWRKRRKRHRHPNLWRSGNVGLVGCSSKKKDLKMPQQIFAMKKKYPWKHK